MLRLAAFCGLLLACAAFAPAGGGAYRRRLVVSRVSNDAKMALAYTCKKCDARNAHTISKLAYEEGIVIVTCAECKVRHLIADNTGKMDVGYKGNIEDLLAGTGEVTRVSSEADLGYDLKRSDDGSIEIVSRPGGTAAG